MHCKFLTRLWNASDSRLNWRHAVSPPLLCTKILRTPRRGYFWYWTASLTGLIVTGSTAWLMWCCCCPVKVIVDNPAPHLSLLSTVHSHGHALNRKHYHYWKTCKIARCTKSKRSWNLVVADLSEIKHALRRPTTHHAATRNQTSTSDTKG